MFGGTRRFWLSRDPDGENYDLHRARRTDPKPIATQEYEGGDVAFDGLFNFCNKVFEDLYPTAKLAPGASDGHGEDRSA
jgi:hypothetical protein